MTFRQRDFVHKIVNGPLYPIQSSSYLNDAVKPNLIRRNCDSCFGAGWVARDRYEPRRLDISCWRCNGGGTIPS